MKKCFSCEVGSLSTGTFCSIAPFSFFRNSYIYCTRILHNTLIPTHIVRYIFFVIDPNSSALLHCFAWISRYHLCTFRRLHGWPLLMHLEKIIVAFGASLLVVRSQIDADSWASVEGFWWQIDRNYKVCVTSLSYLSYLESSVHSKFSSLLLLFIVPDFVFSSHRVVET